MNSNISGPPSVQPQQPTQPQSPSVGARTIASMLSGSVNTTAVGYGSGSAMQRPGSAASQPSGSSVCYHSSCQLLLPALRQCNCCNTASERHNNLRASSLCAAAAYRSDVESRGCSATAASVICSTGQLGLHRKHHRLHLQSCTSRSHLHWLASLRPPVEGNDLPPPYSACHRSTAHRHLAARCVLTHRQQR